MFEGVSRVNLFREFRRHIPETTECDENFIDKNRRVAVIIFQIYFEDNLLEQKVDVL